MRAQQDYPFVAEAFLQLVNIQVEFELVAAAVNVLVLAPGGRIEQDLLVQIFFWYAKLQLERAHALFGIGRGERVDDVVVARVAAFQHDLLLARALDAERSAQVFARIRRRRKQKGPLLCINLVAFRQLIVGIVGAAALADLVAAKLFQRCAVPSLDEHLVSLRSDVVGHAVIGHPVLAGLERVEVLLRPAQDELRALRRRVAARLLAV